MFQPEGTSCGGVGWADLAGLCNVWGLKADCCCFVGRPHDASCLADDGLLHQAYSSEYMLPVTDCLVSRDLGRLMLRPLPHVGLLLLSTCTVLGVAFVLCVCVMYNHACPDLPSLQRLCCLRLCLGKGHMLWSLLWASALVCHAGWLVLYCIWVFLGPHWMVAAVRDPRPQHPLSRAEHHSLHTAHVWSRRHSKYMPAAHACMSFILGLQP